MNDIQGDVRALTAEVTELKKQLEDRKGQVNTGSNVSTFNINAGGVGVWIAATCCAVTLSVTLLMGLWVVSLSSRVQELNQLLNAIYMMAPHLKPEDKR